MMPNVRIRLMVGDALVDGYEPYAAARDRYPAEPLAEEIEGTPMLYSSGTTGRPKGIKYRIEKQPVGSMPAQMTMLTVMFGMDDDSVYLSPAPLYHSAPLFYCMSTMRLGGTVVCMEQFDPEEALRLIEQHHITHSQWVPTMFVRMLKLPDDVACEVRPVVAPVRDPRGRAVPGRGEAADDRVVGPDHRGVLLRDRRHGRDVHQQRSSGSRTPAPSGKTLLAPIHIVDEDGNDVPTGEIGTVWFEPAASRPGFEYHKDEAKTKETFDAHGWASVGDMGYLDADGYLYLTDRRTFMIVSGGVNIYPQEAENVLITHPKVFDVAVFGIPDPEMGEKVHAVVQPIGVGRRRPRART